MSKQDKELKAYKAVVNVSISKTVHLNAKGKKLAKKASYAALAPFIELAGENDCFTYIESIASKIEEVDPDLELEDLDMFTKEKLLEYNFTHYGLTNLVDNCILAFNNSDESLREDAVKHFIEQHASNKLDPNIKERVYQHTSSELKELLKACAIGFANFKPSDVESDESFFDWFNKHHGLTK